MTPINLIKLSVGAESVDDFEEWVKRRTAFNQKRGMGKYHDHVTRMFPKRRDEILNGGSIYWVIKGQVQVRQKIVALEEVIGEDQIRRCAILLEPPLIATELQSRRAFQGWRYLKPEDAPADLPEKSATSTPASLRAELAGLGLL